MSKLIPNRPDEPVPDDILAELELIDTAADDEELNFYAYEEYEKFLEESPSDEDFEHMILDTDGWYWR